MSGAKKLYTGRNGRAIAIDLAKIEMIEDAGDGEVSLHSSSDWYRIYADFAAVIAAWEAA